MTSYFTNPKLLDGLEGNNKEQLFWRVCCHPGEPNNTHNTLWAHGNSYADSRSRHLNSSPKFSSRNGYRCPSPQDRLIAGRLDRPREKKFIIGQSSVTVIAFIPTNSLFSKAQVGVTTLITKANLIRIHILTSSQVLISFLDGAVLLLQ